MNLLFHETFDSLKNSVWNHEVKIPLTPVSRNNLFNIIHNYKYSICYKYLIIILITLLPGL